MIKWQLKWTILLCTGLFASNILAQEYRSFQVRYQNNLRGDLTFIGNNIVNRDGGTATTSPNDPYNNLSTDGSNDPETGGAQNYNDYKNMRFVDVDTDPTTFNSSSAQFDFPQPDCNLIRYAALYWSATYPRDESSDAVGTPRLHPIDQVKFQVPGGTYVDVTADEILYDGLTHIDLQSNAPYACYADVTGLIASMADPTGTYTVANIAVSQGVGISNSLPGGSAGGWTLVVIYENPTLTGKLISTFDGFARVTGTNSVNISYSGFETIPVGPVQASLGAGTLEGDFRIVNDGLSLDGTPLSNASNPVDNFFNSNITLNGADLAGRTPSSLNTLGYDTDIFQLSNPANSVIANSQTSANFTFSTTGDQYYPFFNSFNVEVIEPNIFLEKRVEDIAGNDITGAGVNLGQLLDYVLTFQNLGNDNAINYTIRDVLPINVTLDESSIDLPPGVTYTFNPATRTILFTIPDDLVEEFDPAYSIRMRVKVAENCFDFIDACSDLIENLAYSTYQGDINRAQITDDPSIFEFDACGFPAPGATNFLLDDLENCDFTRTVELCGAEVLLDAGNGFDSYTWYIDQNTNGLVDAGDTVITDGDPDNDPSTILVSNTGTYIVDKDVADPCKGFHEIIVVTLFGTVQNNPITALINDTTNTVEGEILKCGIDGEELPQLFLCGSNDSELIQINIPDAVSIDWEQLDESSCEAAPIECANKDNDCTWNSVGSGSSYLATTAGQYRVVVNYQNGCYSRFYFNVFQNLLDPQYNSRDIICSNPGNITVTNVPANYEFQLVDTTNGNVLVPYTSNPSFDITNSGAYRIEIRQQGVIDGCIFILDDIGIQERNFQVDVTSRDTDCNGLGEIAISVLDVEPQYYFQILQGGSVIDTFGPTNDNNHTFENLNAGTYDILASTDDGCSFTGQATIVDIPDISANAQTIKNIDCTDGIITVVGAGGSPNPDYFYAIWSYNGATPYSDITDIPGTEFQISSNFTITAGNEGSYQFVVVDGNNCWALSNTVTITNSGPLNFAISGTPIVCNGSNSASIDITATGGSGVYEYSIDGGATFQSASVFVGLSSGTYNIVVRDTSGCEETDTYTIVEPAILSASAAVTELAECNPGLGAEVRITNPIGGVAPYEYSFDGGSTYGLSSIGFLLPGNHTVFIRDANGCEFPMAVIVDAAPDAPNLSAAIDYTCDGEATITVTPDSVDFDYSYSINGSPNTPETSNVFTDVPVGTHTITVNYTSNTPPSPSILLFDDFGSGSNTAISEIDPAYCYEPQGGVPTACANGNFIDDGEYTVTSLINPAQGTWLSPNDHSGLPNGRFLAINVGGVAGLGGVIYRRNNIEVIPNRDVVISLWAFNLLRNGTSGGDPTIEIELVDSGGGVIASTATGNIPKNNGANDWQNYTVSLDPGANTNLDIVIRTNSTVTNGNDIAIDDIRAYQSPEACPGMVMIDVVVEDGLAFDANIIAFDNIDCAGGSNGSISFGVENFDTISGFEYQINGGGYSAPQTTSPLSINSLQSGNYTIEIRDAGDPTCNVTLNQTLTEPPALVANASITSPLTCGSTATITGTATGGTPAYQYQLENGVGTVLVPYQNNASFNGLSDGTYIIRVRDALGCEDHIDSALVISPPATVAFTANPTGCYSGNNDATIQVNVTSGNGDYLFRIDGGPWIAPTPSNATSMTYSGLSDGNYTIEVSDGYGCASSAQLVAIDPQLTGVVDVVHLSSCNDGSITVTANGGDGNYEYAFVPTGGNPSGLFSSSNTITISSGNDGDYDVYVRDNFSAPGYCEFVDTVTINPATTLNFNATPTDPQCHNGTGSITTNISSGVLPLIIELIDLDNGGASNQTLNNVVSNTHNFYNLSPGNYTITISDSFGCQSSITPITINNPDELTAVIDGIVPPGCNPDPNQYGFQFINYPNTLAGSLQFSPDGGTTWFSTDTFTGPAYASGTEVWPSIRTVDVGGNTLCRTDLPRYIIPYPLDDLDISITTLVVNCNELRVTVQGTQGLAPYEYAYTDDPASFNAATASWTAPTPGAHTWTGLTPGRTYVFYVRDASPCVRQSSQNVAELETNPMEIDASIVPSCSGASDGQIVYSVVDTGGGTEANMQWELFEVGSSNNIRSSGNGTTPNLAPITVPYSSSITISNLAQGEYYIVVTQIDGVGTPSCISGSQNAILEELDPLSGNPIVLRDLSCDNPGLILIENLAGGGGSYTFTVTGPVGFATISGTSDNPIEIPANSPSGVYNVQVLDQYGCPENLGGVSLNLPPNPTIDSIDINNCITPSTFTINASSAALPILYSIDGGTNYVDNGGVFDNLGPGTYAIAIIDANGCMDTDTAIIHPTLQINAALTALLDCEAPPSNNAEITINATSGSGFYEYEISGPVNQPITPFSGSVVWTNASLPGAYTVTVYDTSTPLPYCNQVVVIDVPALVSPDITVTDFNEVSCNGADDGTISVSTTDLGFGPYTFEIVSGPGSSATFPLAPISSTSTTATFTGLEGSLGGINYTIRVTASNGSCTADATRLITQPDVISNVNAAVVAFGCSSGNNPDNASITIDGSAITGGSGTYVIYEFINDQGTASTTDDVVVQTGSNPQYIETDILGGSYIINAYDSNGCIGSTTAVIPPLDEILSSSTVIVAPSCNPGADGGVTVNVVSTNGDPTRFEYSIDNGSTYQTSNVFTGLVASNYNILIRHVDTGCISVASAELPEPNTFTIDVTIINDVVCYNTASGQVTFELIDAAYSGPIDWNVYNTNGTPTDLTDDVLVDNNSFASNGPTPPISLEAGNYYVEISQGNLPRCTNIEAFTILGPSSELDAVIGVEANVECSNDQGAILVDGDGGWPPYTITLTNTSTGQPPWVQNNVDAYLFTGLNEGVYDVRIVDSRGCPRDYIAATTLVRPVPITADITPSYTLNCWGDTDGALTATITTGGLGTVRYRLHRYDATNTIIETSTPFQTSPTFDNLPAGNYSIELVDEGNCTTEVFATISNPIQVVASLVQNSMLTCTNQAIIELNAIGGTAPYEFSEDGISFIPMSNGDSHSFSVGVGTYQYYVRDANNCVSTISNQVGIEMIPPLDIQIDDTAAVINCTGESTASFSIHATGALGNYVYEVYSDAALTNLFAGPQSNPTFSNLGAGVYYVRVTSLDCDPATDVVTIIEPAPLQVDQETYTDVTCDGLEDGTITVEVSGGTGDILYAITPNLNQFDTVNVFTDLAPGTYDVIAQDENGCFIPFVFEIESPDPIGIAVDNVLDEVCFGSEDGLIQVSITGGTPPYSTSINSTDDTGFVEGRTLFENLAAGTYVIFVRDAQNCEGNITVTIDPGVNLNTAVTPIYECSGIIPNNRLEVLLEDPSIVNDVLYALDSTDPADFQLVPDFINISPGTHYLAIAHSNGCVNTVDFTIQNFEPLTLQLEQINLNEITAIAQGGVEPYTYFFEGIDNGSDNTYRINRTDTYVVRVVDQNGCEAFAQIEMEFFDLEIPDFFTPDGDSFNDHWLPGNIEGFPEILILIFDRYGREVYRMGYGDNGWNGIYNNNALPTGDYWYVIKINGENDDRELVGHFTLYR